jgi:hypothetical protein
LPLATTSPLAAVHLLIILSWPEALNAACAASCQVVAGWLRQRCAPSRLRQPPRPAIPQFLRDPHIRIERSRYVKDLARRPFTSAARGPASLSELVKSVPTLILRQDRLPLESGSGTSFPLDGISDRNGFVLSDVTR